MENQAISDLINRLWSQSGLGVKCNGVIYYSNDVFTNKIVCTANIGYRNNIFYYTRNILNEVTRRYEPEPETIQGDYLDIIVVISKELEMNRSIVKIIYIEVDSNRQPVLKEVMYDKPPFFVKYESGTDCAICSESLSNGQPVCINGGCQHGFHCHCIGKWLDTQEQRYQPPTCPVCRNPFNLLQLDRVQQQNIQSLGFGKRAKGTKRTKGNNTLSLKELNKMLQLLNKIPN